MSLPPLDYTTAFHFAIAIVKGCNIKHNRNGYKASKSENQTGGKFTTTQGHYSQFLYLGSNPALMYRL